MLKNSRTGTVRPERKGDKKRGGAQVHIFVYSMLAGEEGGDGSSKGCCE
jgi:hypothetical protein